MITFLVDLQNLDVPLLNYTVQQPDFVIGTGEEMTRQRIPEKIFTLSRFL
jgi:hypothetical protein